MRTMHGPILPELELWEQCAPGAFTFEMIQRHALKHTSKGVLAIYALAEAQHLFSSPKILCTKAETAVRALEANPDRVEAIIEALQEDKVRLARRVSVLIEFLSDPALTDLFFKRIDDNTAKRILSYSYECSINEMKYLLSNPPHLPRELADYISPDLCGLFMPHESDTRILSWAKCREAKVSVIEVHRTQILVMEILRQSDSSVNYFHGTLSSSLPGIIKAGGLIPLKDQQTLGIDNVAGERRAGTKHNQYVLSAVGNTHPYTALPYAFVGEDLLPSSEAELSAALGLAASYFHHLPQLGDFISRAFHKAKAMEASSPYPLVIGITNTDGKLSPANLRLRGERHLAPVPLEKLILFVPDQNIEETKQYLKEARVGIPVVSVLRLYDYIVVEKRDDIELETAYRAIMGTIKSDKSL